MSYVPTHLEFSPRDAYGWPEFYDSKTKRTALIKACIEILKDGPQSLSEIEWTIAHSDEHKRLLKGIALWDARYALVDRALRECANQVWTGDATKTATHEADVAEAEAAEAKAAETATARIARVQKTREQGETLADLQDARAACERAGLQDAADLLTAKIDALVDEIAE